MLSESHIQALILHQRPFALYRLPNEGEHHFIAQSHAELTHIDDYRHLNQQHGFVIAPFAVTPETPCVIISPELTAQGLDAIAHCLKKMVQSLTLPSEQQSVIAEQQSHHYAKSFTQFHHALTQQPYQKLVLSHPFTVKKPRTFSLIETYLTACQTYPTAFVSLSFTPQTGLWLGASPEILVEGQENHWHTVSLAGTQLATPNPFWDQKNQHEQRLVTQYIETVLHHLSLPYHVSDTYTAQSGHLIHLKADITFQLTPTLGIGDVIAQLHPTPAVCGLPKQKAYQFILANEGYDRRYYSGFIGCLMPSATSHLFVNLRCMQIHPQHITLYAGGGLLESSCYQHEWQEIKAKLRTMRSILNTHLAV